MPTKSNIDSTILNAAYKIALLAKANLDLVNMGNLPVKEAFINYFSLNERGLIYQASWADYTSSTTVTIYDRLNGMIGIPANATIDPNFENPGTTIITVDVVVGYNTDRIYFTDTTDWILANYHTNYYPLYGDNPELFAYIDGGDFSGDDQTPPILTFTTPGDSSTPIAQIHWDRGVATTGYVQISGIAPGSGTSGGGGGGIMSLPFTQDDLLLDGDGAYYLPLSLGTKTIVSVSDNGVGLSATLDTNYTPNRLYGFANNSVQSIIVKVL